MATLARPGRPLAPRVQRAYRLEMAGRTVFLLLTLLALTGLVVFYLGVITGKGLRDPNEGVVATTATDGTAATGANGATPSAADPKAAAPVQSTALNHALQSPTGQIEGLKSDESTANQKTKQLLANGKQELALDEVKPTAPASVASAPVAKTGTQPATQTAAKPVKKPVPVHPVKKPAAVAKAPIAPAADIGDGPYVVQVFSSPQQAHAQEILADLKKKGFPAYMNQFQAADKRTWYRVRVGKSIGSRTEADNLATRLRSSTTNIEPRIMKQ